MKKEDICNKFFFHFKVENFATRARADKSAEFLELDL